MKKSSSNKNEIIILSIAIGVFIALCLGYIFPYKYNIVHGIKVSVSGRYPVYSEFNYLLAFGGFVIVSSISYLLLAKKKNRKQSAGEEKKEKAEKALQCKTAYITPENAEQNCIINEQNDNTDAPPLTPIPEEQQHEERAINEPECPVKQQIKTGDEVAVLDEDGILTGFSGVIQRIFYGKQKANGEYIELEDIENQPHRTIQIAEVIDLSTGIFVFTPVQRLISVHKTGEYKNTSKQKDVEQKNNAEQNSTSKNELNGFLQFVLIMGVIGTIIKTITECVNYSTLNHFVYWNTYPGVFYSASFFVAAIHITGLLVMLVKKRIEGFYIIGVGFIIGVFLQMIINETFGFSMFDTRQYFINGIFRIIALSLLLLLRKNGVSAYKVLERHELFSKRKKNKGKDNEATMILTLKPEGKVAFCLAGFGDVIIDWGDGTNIQTYEILANLQTCSHTYSTSSICKITITGKDITHLKCDGIGLTRLNVKENTELIHLDCSSNQLSINALNDLFITLHSYRITKRKTVKISNNPGTDGCNSYIAKIKEWKVII